MLDCIVISGLSGSGKSVALRVLEDLGYTCIDNLPVRFLADCLTLLHAQGAPQVALAIDARTSGDILSVPKTLASLSPEIRSRVLFLEAEAATLLQRYSETRRPHPLSQRQQAQGSPPLPLAECFATETRLLEPLRQHAHVIDTTAAKPQQLRSWIEDFAHTPQAPLLLTLCSFAYKDSPPRDADLVFDVRCLPNPHYVAELRALSGLDEPVACWLQQEPSVAQMIEDIARFIDRWLPAYTHDQRGYLTVAVGCTGGQHRSVYVVEQLAQRFSGRSPVAIRHRAMGKLWPAPV